MQVYPLAQAEFRISKWSLVVEAAVPITLPVSVFVGRDTSELLDMLNETDSTEDT